MAKKIIHTCYGCPYYYRQDTVAGDKLYGQPYSYRNCDIENPWDCDYFANDGEPNKKISKGE